jgi:adenine-specific DNA-methyltransferase
MPMFDLAIYEQWGGEDSPVAFHGPAETFLGSIPENSIQLIVTSPPYNIGKEYEQRRSLPEYLESMDPIIRECYRVLSPTGSICWQVGNYIEDGETLPLDLYFHPIFKAEGFYLRNRVVWHYRHGLHSSKRFSGRYETILWYSKGREYTFNLDPVRIPQKYPGKKQFRGEKKGELSGNPLGKNPSDVWNQLELDWESCFWDIPNVKHNHPEKTDHPCQFPVELAERCVLALSSEGDWVIDPFMGAGSTLVAAIKNARRTGGSDLETRYIQTTRERLIAYWNGTLRTRQIGTPIYK